MSILQMHTLLRDRRARMSSVGAKAAVGNILILAHQCTSYEQGFSSPGWFCGRNEIRI